MRLLIFGAGYSGQAIARELADRAEWIGGTTRSPEGLPALAATGVQPFLFDGERSTGSLAAALRQATHVLVSIAPGSGGDPALRAAGAVIAGRSPALRWIGYLSTVGVYGDHGGAWVDEESPLNPVSRRSVERVAAEQAWRGAAAGLPLAILRLPGIYGPGRNALVSLQNGSARRIVKPGQVFNRVHVDDIAGAAALLATTEADGVFNVTDDEPAPPQDVVAFAAGLMGLEPPPETPFDAADLTPVARSFYGENKRVSNARLKAAGWRLRHPDYRSGLTDLWESGRWRTG